MVKGTFFFYFENDDDDEVWAMLVKKHNLFLRLDLDL